MIFIRLYLILVVVILRTVIVKDGMMTMDAIKCLQIDDLNSSFYSEIVLSKTPYGANYQYRCLLQAVRKTDQFCGWEKEETVLLGSL